MESKKRSWFFLAAVIIMTTVVTPGCGKKAEENKRNTVIYDLLTCDMTEPVGIGVSVPLFSWKMSSDEIGQRQTAYRITVTDEDGKQVWDSGMVESDDSVDIRYGGQTLVSSTEYSWQLTVFDKYGRACCAGSSFETGLLEEDAFSDAFFISYGGGADAGESGLPAYRRSFTLSKELKSAKLYTTALGVYESYINGARVGRLKRDGSVEYHELKPGYTQTDTRKYYNSYDVTWMLDESGENVLSAVVTNGWWSGQIVGKYGRENAYLAKLVLRYSDGSTETITTGTDWKSACAAAVTYGDIYNGECYDARTDLSWMKPGFDDSLWGAAKINSEFNGKIEAWKGSYITVRKDRELSPVSVTVYKGTTGETTSAYGKINVIASYDTPVFELDAGETALIDLGQNFAGREAFTVEGESGTVISIRHGEMLNDNTGEKFRGNDGPGGSIYNANYRAARAETVYTLAGNGPESYDPIFTFYGFRYIEITSTAHVKFTAVSGMVVTSVEKDIGFIETSDKKINQLFSNIRWGQYSNYLSVPTDCPQRDERLGWMADTQVFAESGCYLGSSKSFLEKFLVDISDAQGADGAYPGVSPRAQYGNETGGTGWADAGIIIPYTLYVMYDDVEAVKSSWESMQKYIDGYLGSTNGRGPKNIWGDWLAYESNDSEIQDMLAAAYYAWDAQMMSEMAAAVGKVSDTEKYKALYEAEKQYFIDRYVKSDGSLRRSEQTACLYALYLDLLPDDNSVKKVISQLLTNIQRNGNRLQTGFLGTKIILDTLTKIGKNDYAYALLLQEDDPSWLYSVNQGATTIWERWNSYTIEKGFGEVGMNSFNHYAYGSVAAWIFRTMAGIGFDRNDPGFKNIIISPVPDRRIRSVNASYDSAYGRIISGSVIDNDSWKYCVTVPANTTAILRIPLIFGSLTVNGKGTDELSPDTDGIGFDGISDGAACFRAVSGSFVFEER